jgi:hypothetical protein
MFLFYDLTNAYYRFYILLFAPGSSVFGALDIDFLLLEECFSLLCGALFLLLLLLWNKKVIDKHEYQV